MNVTWYYSCGELVCGKSTVNKKLLDDGKYPKSIIASAVSKALKIKKSLKLRLRMTPKHTMSQNISTSKKWISEKSKARNENVFIRRDPIEPSIDGNYRVITLFKLW